MDGLKWFLKYFKLSGTGNLSRLFEGFSLLQAIACAKLPARFFFEAKKHKLNN